MEKYSFKNRLLKEALWGRNFCKKDLLKSTNGYFNSDNGEKGRAVIEYCAQKVFNIHRFPGFEPYYLKSCTYELEKEYGLLDRDFIEDACREFKEYYEFLQLVLRESCYCKDGKIRLCRSLRPFEISAASPQIARKQKEIVIPANIINSYSYGAGGFYYGTSMYIERYVDVEKVILWYDTLIEPGENCINQYVNEEYEAWVVEDDVFGETRLSIECFFYKTSIIHNAFKEVYQYHESSVKDEPLIGQKNHRPKPCELNWYTRMIIASNKSKIKEMYPNIEYRR